MRGIGLSMEKAGSSVRTTSGTSALQGNLGRIVGSRRLRITIEKRATRKNELLYSNIVVSAGLIGFGYGGVF
jgi:hypothetical protein